MIPLSIGVLVFFAIMMGAQIFTIQKRLDLHYENILKLYNHIESLAREHSSLMTAAGEIRELLREKLND